MGLIAASASVLTSVVLIVWSADLVCLCARETAVPQACGVALAYAQLHLFVVVPLHAVLPMIAWLVARNARYAVAFARVPLFALAAAWLTCGLVVIAAV